MTDTAEQLSFEPETFSCLAIESANGAGSIAACTGPQKTQLDFAGESMQSRDIYAGVLAILEELELELSDLNCIALGCGPGAFTGLRVSAAVCQALAYGAGIPVVRVSSLAALAAGARRRHGVDCIAPCFDARMGEAYLAVYSVNQDGQWVPSLNDSLIDPSQFRLPPDLPVFAAGTGWSACPDLLEHHAAQIAGSDVSLEPSAVDILALAAGQYRDGLTVTAAEALPNYIRDQVTG